MYSNSYATSTDRNRPPARVWFQHLFDALKRCGFTQSQHDECHFYQRNCFYVLYTDDSLLIGLTLCDVDDIITGLQQCGLKLTVEGTISDFLGVEICHSPNREFHLTQPHLIKQNLKDLHLHGTNVTPKKTPAQLTPLHRQNNDKDFNGHFNYCSVIGKLNYLERCSRPDISFAMHQCTHFSAQPKQAHAWALKWLGRYLYGLRQRGLSTAPRRKTYYTATSTPTSQGPGTLTTHRTLSPRSRAPVSIWAMPDVPFIGRPACKHLWHSRPPKQSTSPSAQRYARRSRSWELSTRLPSEA